MQAQAFLMSSRTALIDGHSNMITGSAVTADRKHLATVSLDFTLKVSLKSMILILLSLHNKLISSYYAFHSFEVL